MACPPLALLLLGGLMAGEPSAGLAHLGGVWKAARGSRRPLWGSKLQWARGMVSEGAVMGRDLASVSPLVSDQMARVPLDSDSAGGWRVSETSHLFSFSEGKLVWPSHCPAGLQGRAIPEKVSSSQWLETELMDILTAQEASWG